MIDLRCSDLRIDVADTGTGRTIATVAGELVDLEPEVTGELEPATRDALERAWRAARESLHSDFVTT